jgi:hypothetical protein
MTSEVLACISGTELTPSANVTSLEDRVRGVQTVVLLLMIVVNLLKDIISDKLGSRPLQREELRLI